MKLFDQLLAAENNFFAYFKYNPQQSRYTERHPILDYRDFHWLLIESKEGTRMICWAPEAFTVAELNSGNLLYAEDVLDWLGANTKTGAKGGVWHGPEYTLVASGLANAADRHYLLFSNAKECRGYLRIDQAQTQFSIWPDSPSTAA